MNGEGGAPKVRFTWNIHWSCNLRCAYCFFDGHWAEYGKRNVYKSVDGGKTFRPNWLSFGAKQADPGEYMVRLRVTARKPEPVGFVERNGKYYGWLEVEDLFSETKAHASGFRTIEWNKGRNQPSRGKVAWGGEGRFAIPFEVPADRMWKIWVRAWVDGFRGGVFKLVVNGRAQYDSDGKHQFTSDSELRFDWVDAGTVHLGEGRQNLELHTFGKCGHMFDVIVLTTDLGYVPAEGVPLPRMTKVARLAGPEGLTQPQPGLFMTEAPVAWARPLAGGPLKTLWVCGDVNEREIVELQRRIEMTADVLSSPTGYFGRSIFGNDLNLDQGDCLYDALAGSKPYDVAVLVRTKLDQIPSHAMDELLQRVRQGMGLIVVRSRREGERETPLAKALQGLEKLPFAELAAPTKLRILGRARTGPIGEGTVVVMPYSLYGTVGRVPGEIHEVRHPFWEYQFAHWIKMLLTAAGRSEGRVLSASCPTPVQPGQPVKLTVEMAGGKGLRLAGSWWAPFSREPAPLTPLAPDANGKVEIALPPATEDGLYRVCLSLLDADGGVLDCAAAHYRVEADARITSVDAACNPPGTAVDAVLTTTNRGVRMTLPARVEVYGARERLLGRVEQELSFPQGEHTATVIIPLIPARERLIEVRLDLPRDSGGFRQRLRRRLRRPQPAVLDDYTPYAGVWENREVPCYCRAAYMRIFDLMGMRATQSASVFWHSLDAGFATASPYSLTSVGSGSISPEGARRPCLHDPAVWEKEEPAIRKRTQSKAHFSPLVLGLGDEMQMGHEESCFSAPTARAFREHVRASYGALDKVNQVWQTEYTDWEEVVPQRLAEGARRPANFAPWLEFRLFMMRTFVDAMVKMQAWVRQEAPRTLVGGVNPWAETWTTCVAYSKLFPELDYAQIYPRFHDRGRSWFKNPRTCGLWSGYGRGRDQIEREAWLLPAYGGTLMCWYGMGRELGYGTMSGTLNLGDRAKWVQACNRELTAGVGRLLIEAELAPETVAVLHSYRSRFVFTALRGAEHPERPALGWDQHFNEMEEGFVALLRSLRAPYRFVDEDQVAAGQLASYELLICPNTVALSDAALAQVRTFAHERPVIATAEFATYDELGRRRPQAPAADLATQTSSVELWETRPPRTTTDNLDRLRQRLAAGQVETAEQLVQGDISFVVSRKLGPLDILIVFGKGELKLHLPQPRHAYDARQHRCLGRGKDLRLLQPRGPAVIVLSDTELPELHLQAPRQARAGTEIQVHVRQDRPLDTAVHLEFSGPDGQPRPWHDANLRTRDAAGATTFVPALNAPAGSWTVRATDVVSGATATAAIDVTR